MIDRTRNCDVPAVTAAVNESSAPVRMARRGCQVSQSWTTGSRVPLFQDLSRSRRNSCWHENGFLRIDDQPDSTDSIPKTTRVTQPSVHAAANDVTIPGQSYAGTCAQRNSLNRLCPLPMGHSRRWPVVKTM